MTGTHDERSPDYCWTHRCHRTACPQTTHAVREYRHG